MRRSALPLLLLFPLAIGTGLAAPLRAQARSDQARLSFGVGLGYNGGTSLWTIRDQVIFGQFADDSAIVGRRVRPTIGVTFIGVYYPNDHWGITGEAHLLGLGYEDHCVLTTNSGSPDTRSVCTNLNGKQTPGTAVATTVGGTYRPFPFTGMQPYIRANLGLVVSEQSSIDMGTIFKQDSNIVFYPMYIDDHHSSLSPTAALAVGATGFIGRGYQLRVEVKDNFVDMKQVVRPTNGPGFEPAWERHFHQVYTLSVALEVVLEKRRGRRY